MTKPRCDACLYYAPEKTTGECHRYAPRAGKRWSVVFASDFCGEHSEGVQQVAIDDNPIFQMGRADGHADVCAALRRIVDPGDPNHWNIDGLIKEVKRLKGESDATKAR